MRTVEADLDRAFADRRVNVINQRREFFFARPAEVRTVLLEQVGNLLEFAEEPEATQYLQSKKYWPATRPQRAVQGLTAPAALHHPAGTIASSGPMRWPESRDWARRSVTATSAQQQDCCIARDAIADRPFAEAASLASRPGVC
jgi:hypothetical protein